MDKSILIVIAAIAGLVIGYCLTYVFRKLPEKWLQDYDYDPQASDFRLAKRMDPVPHGIISALLLAAAYVAAIVCGYDFFFDGINPFRIIAVILAWPIIIMIAMSDRLNRIIPDEFSIALGIIGIGSTASDLIWKSIWFSDHAAFYVPLLNHVIAGLVGFGLLALIGFLSETFLGKEGMGMGDMKLLGACGLIVGCYGLVVTFYVGVILGGLFAIPLFIRKRIRIARENKMIRQSSDPVATRRDLARKKAQIHYAEDPDYLAFGPFLALAAGLFICLEPIWFDNLFGVFAAMGVHF
jgi:prepilin signal peptidase PulO-like enzyme (type II secretory pathway)